MGCNIISAAASPTKKCSPPPPGPFFAFSPPPPTATDLDVPLVVGPAVGGGPAPSTGNADGPFKGEADAGDDNVGGGEAGWSVGTSNAKSDGCTLNTNPKFAIIPSAVSSKHGVFPVLGSASLTMASSVDLPAAASQAGVSANQLGGRTLT